MMRSLILLTMIIAVFSMEDVNTEKPEELFNKDYPDYDCKQMIDHFNQQNKGIYPELNTDNICEELSLAINDNTAEAEADKKTGSSLTIYGTQGNWLKFKVCVYAVMFVGSGLCVGVWYLAK